MGNLPSGYGAALADRSTAMLAGRYCTLGGDMDSMFQFWHNARLGGALAKRLCSGLQSQLVRFDSGTHLQSGFPWRLTSQRPDY